MTEVVERFLREERARSGPRIDPVDRARFHRLVRLCSEIWQRHTETGLRFSRGKQGISLLFDGPIGGRKMALFTLRVDYKKAQYRFSGPNADRERMGLDAQTLETLERLRDLYAALLVETPTSDLVVTAVLEGKPFPDLLPLVEETRRVLDGAPDGSGSSTRPGGSRRARKAEKKARPPRDAEPKRPATAPATAAPPAPAATPRDVAASKGVARSVGARPQPRSEVVVTHIILSCPDPKVSAAFYRRIFGVKSLPKTRPEDHAIYEMGGVLVVLRRELSSEERRRLGYGSVQRNRGWGLTLSIRVPDYEACLRRVRRVPDALLHEEPEQQTMLVQDPAGYVLEVSAS